MEIPTTISPSDLALFLKAKEMFSQAQNTAIFVEKHLAEVYKLDEKCTFDFRTGLITRPEVKE